MRVMAKSANKKTFPSKKLTTKTKPMKSFSSAKIKIFIAKRALTMLILRFKIAQGKELT